MLNGVDLITDAKLELKKSKLIFLVLGRLEADKGILEIIDSFQNLNPKFNNNWELSIIGDGSLRCFVEKAAIDNHSIKYLGEMTFGEVCLKFREIHIVISLNKLGNLSNVVLESINNEKMIITLKEDLELAFDIESNDFLQDNVKYVSRNQIKKDLIFTIEEVLQDRNILKEFSSKTKKNLKTKIISWEDRIDIELSTLRNL